MIFKTPPLDFPDWTFGLSTISIPFPSAQGSPSTVSFPFAKFSEDQLPTKHHAVLFVHPFLGGVSGFPAKSTKKPHPAPVLGNGHRRKAVGLSPVSGLARRHARVPCQARGPSSCSSGGGGAGGAKNDLPYVCQRAVAQKQLAKSHQTKTVPQKQVPKWRQSIKWNFKDYHLRLARALYF